MRAKACGRRVGDAHRARPERTVPERKIAVLMRRERPNAKNGARHIQERPASFGAPFPSPSRLPGSTRYARMNPTGAGAPTKQGPANRTPGCFGVFPDYIAPQ